jgi:tRNA(fMet)-specific endonuclease VapC
MQLYMLDTDTCRYIIKDRPASVRTKFQQLQMEQICISIITYAELLYGVERSSSQRINRSIVDDFVKHLTIQQWDEAAANHYAPIRNHLQSTGQPIGGMDMQIAAHALSLNATLVTNNQRHFSRVPELVTDNWV